MRRRSFIRAAASVVPAAGLYDLFASEARAQAPLSAPPSLLHVVAAGQDRDGHTHVFRFGWLLFKVLTRETNGGLFVVEHPHMRPGGGPPLHLHLSQEEWFYVMEGEVAFQVGGQRLHLYAGESVLAPRRVPHTFSSVAAVPSRMLIAFCPAGKMEQFFLDVENPKAPVGKPQFWRRYEMEL
ncbi:MAG: cupin domain-containing protein, partial [Terriglobia bacterium]